MKLLNNKYRVEIESLNLLINNWCVLAESEELLINLGGKQIDVTTGLCHNAFLYNLDVDFLQSIFVSFKEFNGSLLFPIEGNNKEYFSNRNKFKDVRRLRLAKHIRDVLLIEGEPTTEKVTIFSKLLESNLFCALAAMTIIFVIIYQILTNI